MTQTGRAEMCLNPGQTYTSGMIGKQFNELIILKTLCMSIKK